MLAAMMRRREDSDSIMDYPFMLAALAR
jgi:hypothetical protein